MANPHSNRNANRDQLREAQRLLADAQRETKKTGLRIAALLADARRKPQ